MLTITVLKNPATEGVKSFHFTVPGAPRTKKTSSRLVWVGERRKFFGAQESILASFQNGISLTALVGRHGDAAVSAALREAVRELRGFNKILPSEAHEEWFKQAMQYAPLIVGQLRRAGVELPITEGVKIEAIFYRDANRGDLTGYMQGLADWMQAPGYSKPTAKHPIPKQIRTGAGIIRDDVQILSWGDSHLEIDRKNPRIEVTVFPVAPSQPEMFEE